MTDQQNLELITRTFEFRASSVDHAKREIVGRAVPYGVDADIGGYYIERFAPGAVQDSSDAKFFWRHRDPIGLLSAERNTDGGWDIVARVSKTQLGDDALTLADDGVVAELSVGFMPGGEYTIEEREGEPTIITRTRVRVREVSLVPFGAYGADASVIEVRETQPRKKLTMSDTIVTPTDLAEIREAQDGLTQRFDRLAADLAVDRDAAAAPTDTRSAGEYLRALVSGDESTVRDYEQLVERAYTGGTSADGILTPQYVGDLIRLIEAPNILGSIFASSPLPSRGLKLEYAVLESDTVDVDEQENEGDDLTSGNITLDVDYEGIKTYGGFVQMSRQKIERTTNVNVLDLHVRALGLRAARRKATVLRTHYEAAVAAQVAAGGTVAVADSSKYAAWVGSIIDAAGKFQDLGLTIDALIADKIVFTDLASMTDTTGRPLMTVTGTGVNAVGSISPKALGGDLAGVTVRPNLKQSTPGAAFVNGEAIRQYNSPIVELADENIVNLSKRFGVYYYAANATEIPDAIIPVELG